MEATFGEVNPLLLIGMILGLVEMAKKFGLSGKKTIVVSMLTGIGLGVLYQLQVFFPAMTIWFQTGVYGTLLGLSASGLYNLPRSIRK